MSVEIKRVTGRKIQRFVTSLEEFKADGSISERDIVLDVQSMNAAGLEAIIPLISEIAIVYIEQNEISPGEKAPASARAKWNAGLAEAIKAKVPVFLKTSPGVCFELVKVCSTVYKSVYTPYEIGKPLEEVKDPVEKEDLLSKLEVSEYALAIFNLTDMVSIIKNQIALFQRQMGSSPRQEGGKTNAKTPETPRN